MKLLNGKKLASKIEADIKRQVIALEQKGAKPTLAVILVGDDLSSKIYVGVKDKACLRVGVDFLLYRFRADENPKIIEETIKYLNHGREITGILLQLPMPQKFNQKKLIGLIAKEKDVDGLRDDSPYIMPTPLGILTLLKSAKVKLAGRKITIIGRGFLVGEPLGKLLKKEGAKVLFCEARDSHKKITARASGADILIVATGRRGIVTAEMVKAGAAVVDCGNFKNSKTGRIEGEVDFAAASQKAGWITPVPGGVGPMTVISLLKNVIEAAKKQKPGLQI